MSTQQKPSATSPQQSQPPRQGSASGSRASGTGAGAAAGTTAGTGARPTSSRPGRQSTKPTTTSSSSNANAGTSSSSAAATSAARNAKGGGASGHATGDPDASMTLDPALVFDAGDCLPLLDVFVNQEWVGELDAFVESLDSSGAGAAEGAKGNTGWSVPVVPFTKPVGTAEYPERAVKNMNSVLVQAEKEVMLMAKWAEKIRLRGPPPSAPKLTSDGDLRDRHVVQFQHSTYLFCKDHSLPRDQSSVILSIGKLLFDRILTSVHKGFEPYETPLSADPKSNNNSLKSLAGSKPVLAPGAAGKKGAAEKPPPMPAVTLAANLPVIPAGILRPVLDAYLVKLVAFHTIPSATAPAAGTGAGHHGHGAGQQQQAPAAEAAKHQVLPAKVSELVVQYFRTVLLSQIRLIRLAFTSTPRRYTKNYATSRPSSSSFRATVGDTSGAVAEIHDWRIPAQMRGASRNPPTTGMAAIWYNEPGMVEMEDSDLDEDGPSAAPVVVGHVGGVGAGAPIATRAGGGKRESGAGGGLVGGLQEEMVKALVGVVKSGAGGKSHQGV